MARTLRLESGICFTRHMNPSFAHSKQEKEVVSFEPKQNLITNSTWSYFYRMHYSWFHIYLCRNPQGLNENENKKGPIGKCMV
jgi:hypothetical protein